MNFNKLISNPYIIFRQPAVEKMMKKVPDDVYLKLLFRARMGAPLNLRNPVTFNEKIQWLKLNDRNPLYTELVDKLRVKEWVKKKIGEQYVTPTYASWDHVDDIDISILPTSFALKNNHDSGSVILCHNKNSFNLGIAKAELAKSFKNNYFYSCREWPYKNVKKAIFAEELLDINSENGIIDYKFYCFNGEPKFLYISQGMDSHETARLSFVGLDWKPMPFSRDDYASFDELPPKPKSFDEMIELAKILSSGITFVRVDLFEYHGLPRFSEMTFSPCGGFMVFHPQKWDSIAGSMLDLSALSH